MQHKKIKWWEEGGSGKIGNKVYYQLNGKTFRRKAPGVPYNIVPTEKQAAARQRFTAAHQFALTVINDLVLKAMYEKKAEGKCTAYAKAVSLFLLRQN